MKKSRLVRIAILCILIVCGALYKTFNIYEYCSLFVYKTIFNIVPAKIIIEGASSKSKVAIENIVYRKSSGAFQTLDVRNIYNSFQILKEHFKYIFIDMDREDDKLCAEIVANSDIVWMITNPSLSSFEKIRTMIETSSLRKNVRVVLNKYEKKYEGSLEAFQEALGKQIYCKMPKNFIAIASAQTKMKTLKEVAPDLNIVKAYMSLAKHIVSKG